MKQSVYLLVVPGSDRVHLTGHYPTHSVNAPGAKLFLAEVELEGVEKLDGKLSVVGKEIAIKPSKSPDPLDGRSRFANASEFDKD